MEIVQTNYSIRTEEERIKSDERYQRLNLEIAEALEILRGPPKSKVVLHDNSCDKKNEGKIERHSPDILEPYLIRKFDHPYIIKVLSHSLTVKDGMYKSKMKEEKGDITLYSYIANRRIGPEIPLIEKKRLCFRILLAIDAVHEAGITHCDLKPDNIVMFGEVPKLIDFGLSSISPVDSHCRTAFYGWIGENSQRADLYSLGLIFNFILTGRDPATFTTDSLSKFYDFEECTSGDELKQFEDFLVGVDWSIPLVRKMTDMSLDLKSKQLLNDPFFEEVYEKVDYSIQQVGENKLKDHYKRILEVEYDSNPEKRRVFYYLTAKALMFNQREYSEYLIEEELEELGIVDQSGFQEAHRIYVAANSIEDKSAAREMRDKALAIWKQGSIIISNILFGYLTKVEYI